jgi:calcineurin-like phosphoesterase family protein
MRYAVGDVHGFRAEARAALRSRDLVDADGDWCGGEAEVWFAGDLMDRGPDGVGVIEDVMRWQRQAADTGGRVASVLGNHDLLAVAVRRFRDQVVPGGSAAEIPRSFALSWMVNGGQVRDQELLTDDMADWLADLPAAVRLGDDLLLHADTTEYLGWGDDLEAVNAAISAVLHGDDLALWWELWRCMTTRYAFLGDEGPERARHLLDVLGGERVVHGHSVIADLRQMSSYDVEEAWPYADGLALAVDGGIYDGGPSLVVPLS